MNHKPLSSSEIAISETGSYQALEPHHTYSPEEKIVSYYILTVFGASLLVCFILFTAIGQGIGPFILSFYGLIVYIFSPHRDQISSWLLAHFALLVTVFVISILSTALWLWLLVSFYWASQDASSQERMIQIENRITLEAEYKPTVFGNGELLPINYLVSNQGDTLQTVSLTIDIPPEQSPIALAGVIQPSNIALSSGQVITGSLWVQNQFSASGLRENTVITISIASPTSQSVPLSLPIYVETALGYRVRAFVDTTVNQTSPLILLLASLTPGIALFIQQEINKQELKTKERQKQEADTLIEELKSHLRAEDMHYAQQTLNKLNTNQYQEYANWAITIASDLLELTKVDGKSISHVEQGKRWPEECVATYLYTYDKQLSNMNNDSFHRNFLEARHRLPKGEIVQTRLLDRLAQIETTIENREVVVQARHAVVSLSFTPPGTSLAHDCALTPFAWERAEDDSYYLFHPDPRRTAFQGNSLFRTLSDSEINAIIWSTPGSGRTALGMALAYWGERQKSSLTIYLSGVMSVHQIQRLGIQRLMNFICRHPTYLGLCSETERALLANILSNSLGKDAARALIQRTQVQLEDARWLNEETDPNRRQTWRQLARIQLRSLDKMLVQATERMGLSPFWVNEWVACAQALKYASVRLILDCRMEDLTWLKEAIWPNLYEWRSTGLYTIILVPERVRSQIPAGNSITLVQQLAWNKEQFYDLLCHRYRAFYPTRRQPLEACFEKDDLLNKLITHCYRKGCYHPRRFNQLWSKIVGQQSVNDLAISESMLEDASRLVTW